MCCPCAGFEKRIRPYLGVRFVLLPLLRPPPGCRLLVRVVPRGDPAGGVRCARRTGFRGGPRAIPVSRPGVAAPLGAMQQKLGRTGRPSALFAGPPSLVAEAADVPRGDHRHQGIGRVLGDLFRHQLGGIRLGLVQLVPERQDHGIPDGFSEAALLVNQKSADVVVEGSGGASDRTGRRRRSSGPGPVVVANDLPPKLSNQAFGGIESGRSGRLVFIAVFLHCVGIDDV
mmetsp:Transcript_16529/g.38200  ORF Transcript_16529/g.38200 Transcript_16529/m.38200 type:complete len:229 (+) Transcript_16529:251-937(+)